MEKMKTLGGINFLNIPKKEKEIVEICVKKPVCLNASPISCNCKGL